MFRREALELQARALDVAAREAKRVEGAQHDSASDTEEDDEDEAWQLVTDDATGGEFWYVERHAAAAAPLPLLLLRPFHFSYTTD